MKKIRTILVLLFISFVVLGRQNVQATSLSIDPSSLTVNMNQEFSLDIAISVDSDTPVSASFLYLTFDPNILYFMSAIEGNFFANNVTCSEPPCDSSTYFDVYSDLYDPYDIAEAGDIFIENMFSDMDSIASGNGTYAKLFFKAIGLGTSPLSFELQTTLFGPAPDYNEIADVVKTGGAITVNAVPEPSTLILVASGLIASLGARRFKKKV